MICVQGGCEEKLGAEKLGGFNNDMDEERNLFEKGALKKTSKVAARLEPCGSS